MGIIAEMIATDAKTAEKKDIARNLLRKGSPVDFVSETTGLDESTVLNLQSELTAA